jgi:hypothetical protein
MKKDRKYIFFLVLLFGGYLAVQLTAKKPHNWYLSLDYTSKEPYGTAVLNELLPSVFSSVRITGKTFYELKDSLKSTDNVLVLAREFNPGKEDISAVLALAEKGHTVFLSAESFGQKIKDTLHFDTNYNFFGLASFRESDSLYITFNNTLKANTVAIGDTSVDILNKYYFRTINQQNYFSEFAKDSASVFTINANDEVNTLRMPYGKGQIFISTIPAVFTNIYALGPSQKFASTLLSAMPNSRLVWFESYQVGHRELATPLRYILTTEPLAWAYYLCLFSILVFIVFEARRKQRAIPIIKPLTNASLEFAGTIGTLYFQRGDHKNIAEKRIHFFYDYVRTHFFLSGHEIDFVEKLSLKAVKPLVQVEALVNSIIACQQANSISVSQLTDINKKIEAFYLPAKVLAKAGNPEASAKTGHRPDTSTTPTNKTQNVSITKP